MSASIGTIGWIDMTVDDATATRDFYQKVVGWKAEDTDMGDYCDYTMMSPEDGEAIAGICHARGSNASLKGGWLIYIIVENVDASAKIVVDNGGSLLVEPRGLSGGRFCVIQDPTGATAALYQP